MRKRFAEILLLAAALSAAAAGTASADIEFEPEVMQAYNTAVQGQDVLDGLDVDVTEETVSTKTNVISEKKIDLKVSGITENNLTGRIRVSSAGDVNTEEDVSYTDGWYYYTLDGKKLKKELSRDEFWKMVNSQIYLDMNSSYLQTLYSTTDASGNVTYVFSATDDTIGDYNEKLLDHLTAEQGNVSIKTLQGTMTVDSGGHVTGRDISMTYVIDSGTSQETFVKSSHSIYNQNGTVNVDLPADLSSYTEASAEKPAVTFTEASGTVYATVGINVRSTGSLEGTIIGGFSAGDGMTMTGYTSDGWIQIQYGSQTGYVWGEYTSRIRPVITSGASGTKYATADVNIRSQAGADSQILGVLKKGKSIAITGTTNNGWTRVTYNGQTAYIYSDYLSWSAPVDPNYVEGAVTTGTVSSVHDGAITLSSGISFDTTYAEFDVMDTVETGDLVTVTYTGSASPYTASKVTDAVSHSEAVPEQQGEEDDSGYDAMSDAGIYVVSGVITQTDGWNYVYMSCDDGVYREFDISEAVHEAGNIENGEYVTVSWTSSNPDQVKNISADVIQ